MHRLPTISLLLTLVVLLGGEAVRGQWVAATLPGHVAPEWLDQCSGGPIDVAPAPAGDAIAFSEFAVRVRRRVRAEHGLPTLCRRGTSLPDRCPADDGRDADGEAPLAAAAAAQRLDWVQTARLARARPAFGPELESPWCVVTFGIDGPRLVPLILFD